MEELRENGVVFHPVRRRWCAVLFGTCLSAALVYGYQLETDDHLSFTGMSAGMFLLLAVFCSVSAYAGFVPFLRRMSHTVTAAPEDDRRYYPRVFAGLILCQIPVLLAVYPGFFVYDAAEELNEVATRTFTTHHPLLHVLLLGGVILLVHKVTGSYNAGIVTYTLLQALFICAVFAYVLTYMRRRGVCRKWRIFAFCFLGVFPTVVMYTLCSSKDGLFSACFLLMTCLLMQLFTEGGSIFA